MNKPKNFLKIQAKLPEWSKFKYGQVMGIDQWTSEKGTFFSLNTWKLVERLREAGITSLEQLEQTKLYVYNGNDYDEIMNTTTPTKPKSQWTEKREESIDISSLPF